MLKGRENADNTRNIGYFIHPWFSFLASGLFIWAIIFWVV